ncbi:MAG: UDP-N-acetylmuramoyl-tripeptide--D-alanyl-D-alanine ligase [Gammaproteobacteria bacterium]|nr:UDP-N-acetylmuramoyl-tripeptide--D-alanyl-D-alanine ligase [Gammaproteobacteria bacterium]
MKFISSTNDIRKYLGLKPKKNIKFNNISIDTRTIKKDSLFIALRGGNFNGNKFIEKAFSSGAIAVLCSDKSYINKNNVIYVPSVRKALSKISSEIASDFKGKKILITGSNGKTSTTNIISKSLPKCSSTIKNFNNEIGLPISIMSSKKDSKYMVLEAGAAKKGDIKYLSKIVKPDIGIITNIGNSHLEKLINIEGVFKVKSELIKNIRKGGALIVPNDVNYLQRWKNMAKGIKVIPVPKKFITKNEKISKDKKIMTFDIIKSCSDDKKSKAVSISSSLLGKHNIQNILVCYTCLNVLGESNSKMLKSLKNISSSISRQRILSWRNKSTLIDDTYNANPESVKRSIDVLSEFSGRKIFIFGDMFELGRFRKKLHVDIGSYAKNSKIDILITFGELSKFASSGFQKKSYNFYNEEELKAFIANFIKKNDIVLIKGSRGMKMERFI